VLEEKGFRLAEGAKYVAGHSLGEYSALCAAGALSIADGARLLRIRGRAMQAAVPVGQGAMAALVGVGKDVAEKLAAAAAEGEVCQLANDNDPTQAVISGAKTAIDRAAKLAKEHGVRRFMPLNVSAPFHCALMQPAADRLASELARVEVKTPAVPVVSNVEAKPNQDAARVRDLLARQVTAPVRWEESVQCLAGLGVNTVVEVGAGNVLGGLVRRIAPDIAVHAAGDPGSIEALANG
jgi:[acyl-carrier-protein] S-malonyltransferase